MFSSHILLFLAILIPATLCLPSLAQKKEITNPKFLGLNSLRLPRPLHLSPKSLTKKLRDHDDELQTPAAITEPTQQDYDRCSAARRAYDLYSTDTICYQIFGGDTSYPSKLSCKGNPNPIVDRSLPYGACCSSNNQCSSGLCDSANKLCTKSCDSDSQCSRSAGANFNDRCTNCLCSPTGTICGGRNFCDLCPLYQGNFTRDLYRSSGCESSVVYPDSSLFNDMTFDDVFRKACTEGRMCLSQITDAMGVMAEPFCYNKMQFPGANKTCFNTNAEVRETFLINNYTLCSTNKDGLYCFPLLQSFLGSVYFSGGDPSCDMISEMGCCFGELYYAVFEAGDLAYAVYLDQLAHHCDFPYKTCGDRRARKLSKGAIAGVVVGVVVFALMFVLSVIWCCRRRREELRWREIRDEEYQMPAAGSMMMPEHEPENDNQDGTELAVTPSAVGPAEPRPEDQPELDMKSISLFMPKLIAGEGPAHSTDDAPPSPSAPDFEPHK